MNPDKKSIKINVKTAIVIAAVIVLAALGYVYKGLFIAAVVDGTPISRLSIIRELEKTSGKDLLNSIINERLIQKEAGAKGIVVSNDELDREVKMIEDQISTQGGTLNEALAARGMSVDELKKQILLQKQAEILLANKIQITDEEVAQYIKDNKISIPAGEETIAEDQIRGGLENQKLTTEIQNLLTELRNKASIHYFINY